MTLPKPPREVSVIRATDLLAPKFRAALERTLARMRAQGFTPWVAETIRTPERQAFLYGFGRSYDDGRGIVTQARTADRTWHKYGLAADVVCGSKLWNAPAPFWRALEQAVEAEGLVSGADWDGNDATRSAFKDLPHFQWGNGMRRSPSPEAARLYGDGGMERVWHAVGAD